MNVIAVDNGVTGSIAVLGETGSVFFMTPVKKEQSYTKMKNVISRVDFPMLIRSLEIYNTENTMVLMERPMVNPMRFKASMSALRALESTLIAIETLKLPHCYIDSKEWQKVMLPKGIKGADELKKASLDIGCRLFPQFEAEIKKHGDADSLLIAEYYRRSRK